jgi:hypothetical protein
MTPNRSAPNKPLTFTRDHGVFCPGESKRLNPNQSIANRETNPAVEIKAAGSRQQPLWHGIFWGHGVGGVVFKVTAPQPAT